MKYELGENNIITGILYEVDKDIILKTDINFGFDRLIDGTVVRASDEEIKNAEMRADAITKIHTEISKLQCWFTWYDNQLSQALRAERQGGTWTAFDGVKTYISIADLDKEANEVQEAIRNLRSRL